MPETTNMTIRMDKELKEKAEQLFSELGLNMTTALNIFLRQAVRQQSIPFELKLKTPNSETVLAFEEAEKMSKDPSTKRYASFSEVLSEIQSDV